MADDQESNAHRHGPEFVRYFGPILDALRSLGGEAERGAVIEKVAELAGVTEQELNETYENGRSKYENQVDWACYYLAEARLVSRRQAGRWALTDEGRETHLDHHGALSLFRQIRSRSRGTTGDEDSSALPPKADFIGGLFDDPERGFWFVGAHWGGVDQTQRFLAEGIWQNGYAPDRYVERVQQMKPGDLIAIKASFTRKHGLPFENYGESVSCMRIKAIGTITEASRDGETIKVEWTPLDEPKDWYFYTYRITVLAADVSDELARHLIRFTFSEATQDYGYWLRQPYWARKYRSIAENLVDTLYEEEEAEIDIEEDLAPYGIADITNDGCFLTETQLSDALERLHEKKNLILQGPPGTGKTWLAKRLAYALIGTRDRNATRNRMRAIQFHPSLSYEDMVRGWRPDGNGQLKLTNGVFLESVDAARAERDLPFVVIVEEINRGNPAQIFGEMLTLLEKDKRRADEAIELAYRGEVGERVFIPDNLFVIGTMNIADRSLALVDLALRRRFAFITLEPMLNDRWTQWCTAAGITNDVIVEIKRRVEELNAEIANDRSLGKQFMIGHSYVTPAQDERTENGLAWFRRIVETEIQPLLEEYWFDNPDKASDAANRLLEGI